MEMFWRRTDIDDLATGRSWKKIFEWILKWRKLRDDDDDDDYDEARVFFAGKNVGLQYNER